MTGNETDSGALTPKQMRAIEALLKEPTTAAAAKDAKISETTLWRWLQEPLFSAAYRTARGRLLEGTLTALQAASIRAVETLRAVLDEAVAKPGERVSAARCILEFSLRAREVLSVEERLAYLETMLEAQENRKGKAA